MSDISFKLRVEQLGKSLENLAPRIEAEINQAIHNLASAAYSSIVNKIQSMSMNTKNRKDYLKSLKFHSLGDNSYLIYLDGEWPNKLESGFGAYSIRDQLLKSKKIVGVGSRSGDPWVRTAEDGHKYAAVPFEHRPFGSQSGDLSKDIKKLIGQNVLGHKQAISKIWKDLDGKPVHGKVATVREAENPNLVGLTKYQHVHDSGKVSSLYVTYRMVSETGKDWVHPGHSGYGLFKEVQDFVEKEMDNIIMTLLK